MPEIEDELNSSVTIFEPAHNDIGYCRCCDIEISIPDAHDGLCAVCEEKEDVV